MAARRREDPAAPPRPLTAQQAASNTLARHPRPPAAALIAQTATVRRRPGGDTRTGLHAFLSRAARAAKGALTRKRGAIGMRTIYPVILSGGSGTRLWPLSRAMYPKQFIRFFNDQTSSFLAATLQRLGAEQGFAAAHRRLQQRPPLPGQGRGRARRHRARAPSCSSRWRATPRRPSRSPPCSSRARIPTASSP